MHIVGTNGAQVLKPFPNQLFRNILKKSYSWPDTQAAYFIQGKWRVFVIDVIDHF
jgi:hypothetical protein